MAKQSGCRVLRAIQYLKKSKEYEEIKEELDYVKKYFPEPRKNIPNLLAELSSLDAITGG